MNPEPKLWYTSKQLWANVLAAIALIIQYYTHFVFPPEIQSAILILINFILRAITKQPIVWSQAQLDSFKKSHCD